MAGAKTLRNTASSIGQALDIKDSASQPLAESLRQALRDRHLLLVPDNFERVAAAAPLLSRLLLETCGELKRLGDDLDLLLGVIS